MIPPLPEVLPPVEPPLAEGPSLPPLAPPAPVVPPVLAPPVPVWPPEVALPPLPPSPPLPAFGEHAGVPAAQAMAIAAARSLRIVSSGE
jgi:hypothetical protein